MNNFKNIEDGAFGRILSYNDLSDRRERTKNKNDGSEDESDEEREEELRIIKEEKLVRYSLIVWNH